MSASNETSTAELICKIKKNDGIAFRLFFNKMQPSIFNFLYRYTFDTDTAKDLTQESFIKFWESRDKIDTDRYPVSFLFKIARNLALNQIQRRKTAIRIEENDNILVELIKHPEEDYEQKFLMNDFKKAIILLPERCRVIFILSRYHNFKYEEIAETLDISIQTVKNQMNKSLSILRKYLHRYID